MTEYTKTIYLNNCNAESTLDSDGNPIVRILSHTNEEHYYTDSAQNILLFNILFKLEEISNILDRMK